jgi:hypothetical protein
LLVWVTLFGDGSSIEEASAAATHAGSASHQNRTAQEPIAPEDNAENPPPDLAAPWSPN